MPNVKQQKNLRNKKAEEATALMEEARLTVLRDEKEEASSMTVYSVEEALAIIAGKFYWVPVYKMMKKQKLINNRLLPGELLIDNDFALTTTTPITDHIKEPFPKEEFYITSSGLKFVITWFENMVWNTDELYPEWYISKPSYCY